MRGPGGGEVPARTSGCPAPPGSAGVVPCRTPRPGCSQEADARTSLIALAAARSARPSSARATRTSTSTCSARRTSPASCTTATARSAASPPAWVRADRVGVLGYFAGQGLAGEPIECNGRSDDGASIAVGIPAGGLFSGAEGVKTEEQAQRCSGTAGEPYDACCLEACDDINNPNTRGRGELADAAAHATMTLAKTRSGSFEDAATVRPCGRPSRRTSSTAGRTRLAGHRARTRVRAARVRAVRRPAAQPVLMSTKRE